MPGINCVGLAALPRLAALSSWPTERRLVGARSQRVAHLHLLLALLRLCERAGDARGKGARRLAWQIERYARSVPGAWDRDETLDRARVAAAAAAELAELEPDHLAERREAARRLAALPEYAHLWGRPIDAVGAGRSEEGRRTT